MATGKPVSTAHVNRWASQGAYGMHFVLCTLVSILLFVVAPNGRAEGRPRVTMVDYHNIALKTLVSTYRQAYVDAGFQFQKETGRGKQGNVHLAFTFSLPDSQHKNKKAGASIVIHAQQLNAVGVCSPCGVHRETLGVFSDEYVGLEYENALRIIYSADAKANAYVRKELGKSLGEVTLEGSPKR